MVASPLASREQARLRKRPHAHDPPRHTASWPRDAATSARRALRRRNSRPRENLKTERESTMHVMLREKKGCCSKGQAIFFLKEPLVRRGLPADTWAPSTARARGGAAAGGRTGCRRPREQRGPRRPQTVPRGGSSSRERGAAGRAG